MIRCSFYGHVNWPALRTVWNRRVVSVYRLCALVRNKEQCGRCCFVRWRSTVGSLYASMLDLIVCECGYQLIGLLDFRSIRSLFCFFFISGCDACEPYCKALPGMHNSMSKKMPKIFLTSRDYESLRNVFEDKLIWCLYSWNPVDFVPHLSSCKM